MQQGNTAFREGRFVDAERDYQAALQLRIEPSPELAASLNNLGSAFQELGRFEQAERLYLRSIHMWGESAAAAQPLNNLGTLYRQQHRYAEAARAYDRSLTLRLAAHGPDHPATARVIHNLGRLHQLQNRLAEAEPMYRRALDIFERSNQPAAERAGVLGNLAAIEAQGGRMEAARLTFEQAIRLAGADHPVLIDIHLKAALAEQSAARHAGAAPHFERARHLAATLLGERHPITATIDTHYAATLRKLRRKQEAAAREESAKAVLRGYRASYTVDLAELTGVSLR